MVLAGPGNWRSETCTQTLLFPLVNATTSFATSVPLISIGDRVGVEGVAVQAVSSRKSGRKAWRSAAPDVVSLSKIKSSSLTRSIVKCS